MSPSRPVVIDVVVTALVGTLLAVAFIRVLVSGMCCQ
jgi:hypothetical protein